MWVEGCLSKCSSVSSLGYSRTLFALLSSLYHDIGWVYRYWILDSRLWTVCVWDTRYCYHLLYQIARIQPYSFPLSPVSLIFLLCIPEILSPLSYPCVFPLTLELTLIEVNYLSLTILCAPCV